MDMDICVLTEVISVVYRIINLVMMQQKACSYDRRLGPSLSLGMLESPCQYRGYRSALSGRTTLRDMQGPSVSKLLSIDH